MIAPAQSHDDRACACRQRAGAAGERAPNAAAWHVPDRLPSAVGLPYVIKTASPGEPVPGWRAVGKRRAPEHEEPVDANGALPEVCDLCVRPFPEYCAGSKGNLAPPELRCSFRVERTQKVPDTVRLVLRHERGAFPCEELADSF